jgi:hypothetical protein
MFVFCGCVRVLQQMLREQQASQGKQPTTRVPAPKPLLLLYNYRCAR